MNYSHNREDGHLWTENSLSDIKISGNRHTIVCWIGKAISQDCFERKRERMIEVSVLKTRVKASARRVKRKVARTSFYGTHKDTRFNVGFERPSFGAPGLDLCGPHVSFGATERSVELEKQR